MELEMTSGSEARFAAYVEDLSTALGHAVSIGMERGLWRTFGAAMQKRGMQPFRGRSGLDDNALKRREHHP